MISFLEGPFYKITCMCLMFEFSWDHNGNLVLVQGISFRFMDFRDANIEEYRTVREKHGFSWHQLYSGDAALRRPVASLRASFLPLVTIRYKPYRPHPALPPGGGYAVVYEARGPKSPALSCRPLSLGVAFMMDVSISGILDSCLRRNDNMWSGWPIYSGSQVPMVVNQRSLSP